MNNRLHGQVSFSEGYESNDRSDAHCGGKGAGSISQGPGLQSAFAGGSGSGVGSRVVKSPSNLVIDGVSYLNATFSSG